MTIRESHPGSVEPTTGVDPTTGDAPIAAIVPPDSLAGLMTGNFPSANLMPPGILLARKVAEAKRRALLMVLGVLGIIALLVAYTMVQQRAADRAKAEAQTRLDVAVAEKQQYAYVPAVYSAVNTAREDMATAMGQEVQVTRLLGGLSAMQPPGLSLDTMTVTVGPATDQTLTTDQTVLPGVGEVTFTGEARTMQSIADWLERVRDNADYASPILNEVNTTQDNIFGFDASADLTDQALSGRFVEATQ